MQSEFSTKKTTNAHFLLLKARLELVEQLIQVSHKQSLSYQVLAEHSQRQAKLLKHPWKTGVNQLLMNAVDTLTRFLPYQSKRWIKQRLVKVFENDQVRAKVHGTVRLEGVSQAERFHLLHDVLNKTLLVGVDDHLEQTKAAYQSLFAQVIDAGWDIFFIQLGGDADGYELSKVGQRQYQVMLPKAMPLCDFCADFKIHCPLALVTNAAWQQVMAALPGCFLLSDKELNIDCSLTESSVFSDILEALFPKVSVIVLTYNNLDLTQACLSSLQLNTHYPNFELIIVDNSSSDGTVSFLKTYGACHENTKVVFNHVNHGFAKGNNIGIDYSTGDYLVILNNDTYVTEGWLHDSLRHFYQNDRLGLLGPVTGNIDNEAKINISYGNMLEMGEAARNYTSSHLRESLLTDHISFFCTMIPRFIVDKVGALSEDYSVGLFEDDDYCQKVLQAGYQIAIAEDVFVHHEFSASIGQLKFAFQEELLERNKAIFEKKWGKWKGHRYR